jgi:Flp pilus assembly protein TadB
MNTPIFLPPYLLDYVQPALVLLAAITGGLAVLLLARRVDISMMLAPAPGRVVAAYAGRREPTTVERVGNRTLARIPVLGTLLGLSDHLRWLALMGDPPAPATVVGMAVLLALGGLLLAVITLKPFLAILGIVGFLYPFIRIRNQANKVRAKVERSLPELAAILAAEMSAGLPPDQALERAGSWTAPSPRSCAG